MWIPTPSSGDISLYFHLPFCQKKCDYCHFYVIPNKTEFKEKLLSALLQEIKFKSELLHNKNVVSVYFGGGTPALVGSEFIDQILSEIRQHVDIDQAEVTLELNPENHSVDLLKGYAQAGINRLSIGAQTFEDNLLKKLGRTHSSLDTLKAIDHAHAAGIDNISIDLMYDLPGQTLESWKSTLKTATGLPITHLSLYNLSIEPHTVFYKHEKRIRSEMPSSEDAILMFDLAQMALKKHGFEQYEISAFCKRGAYSKHNVGYWLQRPHLGFGPSAYSFWNQKRFQNVAHLNKYCQRVMKSESTVDFEESLSEDAFLKESLALHLRLTSGFDTDTFQRRFGLISKELKSLFSHLESEDLIQKKNTLWMLTEKGMRHHDSIAAEIV